MSRCSKKMEEYSTVRTIAWYYSGVGLAWWAVWLVRLVWWAIWLIGWLDLWVQVMDQ
jgi:hypothetical protein